MKRSFHILLALGVGIGSFLFFVLMFFPLDAAIEHNLSRLGGIRISYSRMRPSLIFDTVFEDFRLEQKRGSEFEEVLFAKRIDLDATVFQLASRTPEIGFSAVLAKGKVEGEAGFTFDAPRGPGQAGAAPAMAVRPKFLDVEFDGVELGTLSSVKKALSGFSPGSAVRGELDGEVSLLFSPQPERSEGDFDLKITGLTLRDISFALMGTTFTVPKIVLSPKESPLHLVAEMHNGTFRLKKFEMAGGDIEFQLSGNINFGPGFTVRSSSLQGRFALSDMLFEKFPPAQMLNVNNAKTADGFYPINIRGSGERLQVRVGSTTFPEFNINQMLK